ncbi:MAG: protein kinase [Verrucomicrobiota bacterium]
MRRCAHCQTELQETDVLKGACPACGRSLVSTGDASADASPAVSPLPSPDALTVEQVATLWRGLTDDNARPEVTVKLRRPEAVDKQVEGVSARLALRQQKVLSEAESAGAHPHYELLGPLGEGGMGVIYEARQTSVDRVVALKVMKPEPGFDEPRRKKFLSEVVATGALEHPNIVPVYELGLNQEGLPFYAMKRIRGRAWSQSLGQKGLRENLEIFMAVANAVSFAHSRGVIHRDVKPENVMLGDYGEVLLIDWGLAAAVSREGKAEVLTSTTALAGTPAYMAPEMARGETDKIGVSSDVYLLGAVLYEIVTGVRPHRGKTVYHCLANAANNVIEPTNMRGELLDIALHATATEPASRYPSVKDFQAVVREYISHADSIALSEHAGKLLAEAEESAVRYDLFAEAVAAYGQAIALWKDNGAAHRGLSRARRKYAERALKKQDLDLARSLVVRDDPSHHSLITRIDAACVGRDRKGATLLMIRRVVTGSAAAVFAIMAVAFFWIRAERSRAVESAVAAQEARESELRLREAAEYDAYVAKVALSSEYIERGEYLEAQRLLESCSPRYRHWEWAYLMKLLHLDRMTIDTGQGAVIDLVVLPGGKQFVSAGVDGTLKVWDLAKGTPLSTIKAFPGTWVIDMAVLRGGLRVAVVGAESRLKMFELGTGRELWSVQGPKAEARSLAASQDGQKLATVHGTLVVLWDAASGKKIKEFDLGGNDINAVDFSPDGGQLAASGGPPLIKLIDVASGEEKQAGRYDEFGWISSLAYSSDGRSLLLAGGLGLAGILDLSTTNIVFLTGHRAFVSEVADLQDRRRVITASQDGSCIVWDRDRAVPDRVLRGHFSPVETVAVAPDGCQVATGCGDGTLKIWDLTDPDARSAVRADASAVFAVAFSRDDKRFAAAGTEGRVRLWRVSPSKLLLSPQADGWIFSLAALPDGNHLICAGNPSNRSSVVVVDTASGTLRKSRPFDVEANDAALSPDGAQLVMACRDTSVRLIDVRTLTCTLILKGHTAPVMDIAFFPDGEHLLSMGFDGARIWSAASGDCVWTLFRKAAEPEACAVSSDGSLFFADGIIWDRATRREKWALKGHAAWISAAAFSPDGKRIVTGSRDGTMKIWDVETGRSLVTLRGHNKSVWDVAFSADGKKLLSGGADGRAVLWDASGKYFNSLGAGSAVAQARPVISTAVRQAVASGSNLVRNASFGIAGSSLQQAYCWELGRPDERGGRWGTASRQPWRGRQDGWEGTIGGQWAGSADGGWWQEVAAVPGRTYEASAWFWADRGQYGTWTSSVQGIKIEVYAGSGARRELLRAVTNCFADLGEAWTQKVVRCTAPEKADWVRLEIFASGVGKAGSLQIDDVSLTVPPGK